MHEVERRGERRDRRAQLVRDVEEELLLEPQELRARGDVAHGVDRRAWRRSGERRRHDLEHAHPVLAREPRAPERLAVGVLHRHRAGDDEQVLERAAEELVLPEQPERRGVRGEDLVLAVADEDAVGEGDERVLERDVRDRVGLPAPAAAPLGSAHDGLGMRSRIRVPLPGLESMESCAPMSRAASRICKSPRLPRPA